MSERQYITSPIPDEALEEDRQQAINRPDFVSRQRKAGQEGNLHYTPDGLYVNWLHVDTDEGTKELACLADDEGCILTLGQLKILTDITTEIYDYFDDDELEQMNLRQREHAFINWVELNSGQPYEDVIAGKEKRRQKEEKKLRPGFVYVVEGQGAYKIGRTKDPGTRITRLEVKLPFPISAVCVIASDDYIRLEVELHKRFKDKRLDGEWFDLAPEDIDYLKHMAQ